MLICQLTDLHVQAPSTAGQSVPDTNRLTERACAVAADFSPHADVVLITGDLTESGLPEEYESLAGILSRTLAVPVYVIPGNHDQRNNLRTGLSMLPGLSVDQDFIQYVIEDRPVRIVMLDTLVPGQAHGELSAEQLHWLDQTLAERPSKPTLIAMHHPPFITGLPHMDQIGLRDMDAFRAVIGRHPQVQRIISGHHHRPIIGQCAQAVASISPSVAHQIALTLEPADPGAFNFEPPAFQLHLWQEDTGFVSHTVYTDAYPGPFAFHDDTEPATP